MQKRGLGRRAESDVTHHLYLYLFEFVILITVFIALMSIVNSFAKNTLLEKSFLSKDLALLTTVVYASPGTLNYVYTQPDVNIKNFSFAFQDKLDTVSDAMPSSARANSIFYYYGSDGNIAFNGAMLEKPPVIAFSLSENKLTIASAPAQAALSCPDISTADLQAKSLQLVIDPGHGEDTRLGPTATLKGAGYVNSNTGKKEQDVTKGISQSLATQLQSSGYQKIKLTRQGDEYVSIADRLTLVSDKNTAMAISIHTGFNLESDTVRVIIANGRPNSLKSEKLGCLILRQMLRAFPALAKAELVRLDSISSLSEDNPQKILDSDNLAVSIEIGDLESDSGILQNPLPSIANPIKDAITSYYET